MSGHAGDAMSIADEQLAVWRAELAEHDEILRDDMDELEAHVQASAAAYQAEGMGREDAARLSIADLGSVSGIAAEYATMDPSRVWRRRIRRMLLGPLVAQALCLPLVIVTGLISCLLLSNGYDLVAVGWPSALACCGVALVVVAAAIRVAGGRPASITRRLRHAARWRSSSSRAGSPQWV